MSEPDSSTDTLYPDWIGRTETAADIISPSVVERLWATLDRPDSPPRDGDPLPLLAHWLFFLSAARQSQLGPDGHEKRGHFIPPTEFPRRMWAGSRVSYHHPIRIGSPAERRTTIRKIVRKEGRTGPLVFLTLGHEIFDSEGVAIEETQDIVYREGTPSGAVSTPPEPELEPAFSREVTADAVMLFRYSALTFNGHKIHYDRAYATETEGYPGLVVHGPMIAALLIDLLDRFVPGFSSKRLEIRAISPLYEGMPFSLNGISREMDEAELWACNPDGRLAMKVSVNAA